MASHSQVISRTLIDAEGLILVEKVVVFQDVVRFGLLFFEFGGVGFATFAIAGLRQLQ